MKAFSEGLLLLAANTAAADDISAGSINFGSILVSFLYFLGALFLIYIVLVLVNKLGRNSQKQNNEDEKQDEKESEKSADADKDKKDNRDSTGENNG